MQSPSNLDKIGSSPIPHAGVKLINYLYSHCRTSINCPRYFDQDRTRGIDLDLHHRAWPWRTVQSLNIQRPAEDIPQRCERLQFRQRFAMDGMAPSYSGSFNDRHRGRRRARMTAKRARKPRKRRIVAARPRLAGACSSPAPGNGSTWAAPTTPAATTWTAAASALGVDYKIYANFAIGLAAGYTGTTADLTDRERVWVNGGKIGALLHHL